ncbi:hypothetical protein K0M31_018394 [Melipona bicolor]|uniref:Uncharacterized protein n=1 Tax=Melipona bicolor TaxID=60889 RepID=A0AA40KRN4_9HYME|nr:hypothetical protein K0M31_018394 [Melipona bicolor]
MAPEICAFPSLFLLAAETPRRLKKVAYALRVCREGDFGTARGTHTRWHFDDDAKIPIEANSGRLVPGAPRCRSHRKRRGAGDGQVLRSGIYPGCSEGSTGPVLDAQRPAASLNAARRAAASKHPFSSVRESGNPVAHRLPPVRRRITEAVRASRTRGRSRSIFARMWARCRVNCNGKRHLLINAHVSGVSRADSIASRSDAFTRDC